MGDSLNYSDKEASVIRTKAKVTNPNSIVKTFQGVHNVYKTVIRHCTKIKVSAVIFFSSEISISRYARTESLCVPVLFTGVLIYAVLGGGPCTLPSRVDFQIK